jgi:hypothetical protein
MTNSVCVYIYIPKLWLAGSSKTLVIYTTASYAPKIAVFIQPYREDLKTHKRCFLLTVRSITYEEPVVLYTDYLENCTNVTYPVLNRERGTEMFHREQGNRVDETDVHML